MPILGLHDVVEEFNARLGRLIDVLVDEHEVITPDQASFIWHGPGQEEEEREGEERVSEGKGKSGGKGKSSTRGEDASLRGSKRLGVAAESGGIRAPKRQATTPKDRPCQNANRPSLDGCEKVAIYGCTRRADSKQSPKFPNYCRRCYDWYASSAGQSSLDFEKTVLL